MKTVISNSVRIKSVCFTLFFFLQFFLPISQLHCEPHRLLGDEGALLWAAPNASDINLYSINENQQAVLLWNSKRTEDAIRLLYYQIYNIDGSVQLYTPAFSNSNKGQISTRPPQ
jgi:hypothetical protein